MFKRIIWFCILMSGLSVYSSPLSWRTFSSGKYSWICSQRVVYVFSSDANSIYPLELDQTRTVGNISDVIVSDNYLFFSTEAGIYNVDMTTQSIERIVFENENTKSGVLASDMDYLWIASNDTLFRYDKLGAEWSSFPLPEKIGIISLKSDGEKVECLGISKISIFTINTEKWSSFSSNITLSDSASILAGMNSKIAIKDNVLNIYNSTVHQWEQHQSEGIIQDVIADDTVMFYAAGNRIVRVSNGISRNIAIPDNGKIHSFTKASDTLFALFENRFLKFNLETESISFVELPADLVQHQSEKMIVNGTFIIVMSQKNFAIFNTVTNSWTIVSSDRKQTTTKVSWRELGPTIQYKPGLYTNVKGYIESTSSLKSAGFEYDSSITYDSRYKRDDSGNIILDSLNRPVVVLDSTIDIDSTLLMKWKKPDLVANVTIRSTDPDGRTLDISLDNSNKSVPPKKNITYKGTKSDILNLLRGGTNQTDIMLSQLHTPVQYEGGQVVVESQSKVSGKDRKIAKVGAGVGFITSRAHWRVLKYSHNGIYYLTDETDSLQSDSTGYSIDTLTESKQNDTTQIIPGSLYVWVDGARLDSTYYTFFSTTATLKIDPSAPIDPVSLITVSYKVQPIPERGNEQVEFKPRYNFGKLYYGTATISPFSWVSLRAGIESDERSSYGSVINTALPLELRKENSGLLFKITPEFSINADNKSKAGALDFQSRIGQQLEVSFNGLLVDDQFTTTDTFTLGYGKIKRKYAAGVNYEIIPEIPLQYSQHQFSSLYGNEQNYHFHTGVRFSKLPFFDFDISRTILDDYNGDTITVFDSLFQIKDRMVFKLYETTSPYLESIAHFKKIAYELVHTEYRYKDSTEIEFFNGQRTDAKLTLIPIHAVIMSNRLTYRNGNLGNGMSDYLSPSVEVLTTDFPPGADIQALYRFTATSFDEEDSSSSGIERSVGITLRPGKWYQPLRWLSLNGTVSELIDCVIDNAEPQFSELVNGSEDKSHVLTKTLGVRIFPNQVFYLRNKNQWVEQDSISSFLTTNDIEVLFNSSNAWKNSLSYTTDYTDFKVNGSSKYTWRVNTWFQLAPELKSQFESDSLGNSSSFGPQLSTSIVLGRWLFIKSLFNDQNIALTWHRKDGVTHTTPDVSYFFRLDFVVLPNIKISNQEVISYKNGDFENFTGKLNCTIIF